LFDKEVNKKAKLEKLMIKGKDKNVNISKNKVKIIFESKR
jgi:hypothetical protein